MKERQQQDLWDRIWRDRRGAIIIYQHPNAPLIAWLVLTLVSLFTSGGVSTVIWYLSEAALGLWALWEIVRGVNYFRRALGAVVLLLTIATLFKIGY